MINKAKPVPAGYHTLTPYLIINGAGAAIDFYKMAFGATESLRIPSPGGKVGHAELKIGDSPFMLADECPEMGARSPQSLGGTPVSLLLYVADVDAVCRQAVAAGGKLVRPVTDQFYGDRSGAVQDPFGHIWHVSTHIEDVPPEELQRRSAAMREGKK
jgi:PhnB protein